MIQIELTSGRTQQEIVVDWGELHTVRAPDPVFVFVTGPGITRVTAADGAVPLLKTASGATAAIRLEGGSVIGPVRIEATAVGQLPARVDILMPAAERALGEFLNSIRLVEVALPRLRGGFVYLDSAGIPRRAIDPFRVAVFIKDNFRSVVAFCRQVADEPRMANVHSRVIRPPGPTVDIAATRNLLLRRPELLAPSPKGVASSPAGPLAPCLVVSRARSETVDIPENRRIARFVGRLWFDAEAVAKSGVLVGDDLNELFSAQRELASIMSGTLLGRLPVVGGEEMVLEASDIERNDVRYAALHALRIRYVTEVAVTADVDQLDRQHTARPDEVFEALCTFLLAAAFEMAGSRGEDGRELWVSDEWVMYANRVGVIRSWRTGTSRPDDYRPDFVLVRRHAPNRCVLLDAKASVDSSGRVPGERLKEVHAYLNAFGMRRAGVLFPGPMDRARFVASEDISANGYLLRELPVRPVTPEDLPLMLENLRAQVSELEDESEFAEDA
jgi:hypothetical protein